MIDKIKTWASSIFAAISVALYFLLRSQKTKTAVAEEALAQAAFKLTTQENNKKYEDAKNNADRLVTEYQSARRTDTAE